MNSAQIEQPFMSADCGIMRAGPLCVVIWRGATTQEALSKLSSIAHAALRKSPEGVVMLGIVETTTLVPDADARRLAAETNDELAAAGARAFAGVIAQQGFFGAWVRGVISGLHLLSRRPYPFRPFRDTPEAVSWLLQHTAEAHDGEGLTNAVERFRREYSNYWFGTHQQAS